VLAAALNERSIPGVRAYPVRFTPSSSVHAGQACGGVSFIVTDREAFRPTRLGIEVAVALTPPLSRAVPSQAGRIA
jgi:uncharacterized protein YbbC (DUF1343 family)